MLDTVFSSVVGPDPDSHGSEPWAWIRIRIVKIISKKRLKVLKIFIDDFLKLIQIRLTMCHSRANKLGCTKSRDTVPLSLSRRLSILTLLLYILHRVWNSLFCSFALRSVAQNGSFQERL